MDADNLQLQICLVGKEQWQLKLTQSRLTHAETHTANRTQQKDSDLSSSQQARPCGKEGCATETRDHEVIGCDVPPVLLVGSGKR